MPQTGDPAVETPALTLSAPARQEDVARARRALQGWLIDIDWPAGGRTNIVLAASEALTNAADHAYPSGSEPGPVHLHARLEIDTEQRRRRVTAVVADEGHWSEPPTEHGDRGRGLAMMRQCMDQVRLERTPTGTQVVMDSAFVPLRRPR